MPLSGLSAMSSTFHQAIVCGFEFGNQPLLKKKGGKAAYHDLLDPSKVEALYKIQPFFGHHLLREE